jgi:hypothetical protein
LTLNTKTTTAVWAARSLLRVLTARAVQGFATDLTGAFEAIPVATGGELIISRVVFTRLVLISAHTKKIDANKHMTANKPVYPELWRLLPGAFS